MNKFSFRVTTAEDVDEDQLDHFMRGYFSKVKCAFLREHGLWRHKSNKHRMIVLNDSDQIVGYCAAIPTTIWLVDREMPALFWVDNYVPPKWRGRRIQSLTDQAIRQVPELHLGFPNEFVVPIHRKHGWMVREDCSVMLMPLIPSKIVALQTVSDRKKFAFRFVSQFAKPAAWLWRRWLKDYQPSSAQILEDPDPEFFAAIFRRYRDGWVTVDRSAEYFNWRYIQSPHQAQYTFFAGGSNRVPSLVVICRTFDRRGSKVIRILDIFGDLEDRKGLSDVLRLVAREAIKQGVSQVTIMATDPSLKSILKSNGFILSVVSRFRCYSQDPSLMEIVGKGRCHWALADSDNDTVD